MYNKRGVMGDWQGRFCERLGEEMGLFTRPANRYRLAQKTVTAEDLTNNKAASKKTIKW